MFKRIGVALLGAMLGVAVVAGPASSAPEPRFTLTIDPTEGKVGTNIHAQLPAEATTPGGPCVSADALVAGIQSLVGNLIGQGPGSLPTGIEKTLAGLTNTDSITKLDPNDPNLLRFFFVLAFADPATQQPAIDQTTGQASETSFWDPDTGQGDITAPAAQRPSTYSVAGVCLKLKTPDQVDPAEVGAALQSFIEATPGLAACLGGATPDQCVQDNAQKALAPLLAALINQDADIAWVAPFCLLGDNGEKCGGPTGAEAAQPVAAEPLFTG
jgi:hypothetical protein